MQDGATADDHTREIVARCERSEISPAVALMELLIATEDAGAVDALLQAHGPRSAGAVALRALFDAHEEGCRRVAAMLSADVDRPLPPGASLQDGLASCRTLFDWSVHQSEAASVALYSLGSPHLLAMATAEIVALLREWGTLGRHQAVLDVGCGTGRMEEALASEVGHILGLDLSAEMVAAARNRCAKLANVIIAAASSGLDLRPAADASYDVVLAVDSFPYVVQAGHDLAERMFSEAARVLRRRGEFLIFNFSYRGDRARDQAEARALAARHGFDVLACGVLPFRLWNGDAYRLRIVRG